MPINYKDAGVDVENGQKEVELIKNLVEKTQSKNVLSKLGGFSGLFSLENLDIKNPVLVSGTDGVGTKVMLAQMMDKHDTIGIDCVAMCVNDILCQGARPLFFLDYIACGKLVPEKMEKIVKGVADGCLKANSSLIGGETAEMPGLYKENDYDLAGFCVGIVDKEKIITGEKIKKGDHIFGLKSSGIHSNGYSLVRKIVLEKEKLSLDEKVEGLDTSLGEELLKPTKIYVKEILNLLEKIEINGLSHITGGGFYENIPRMIPDGLCAKIDVRNIP
ncbi:MAG: phosphoribosylformylglycinamidine cyclo-ligase, partial [Anaerococcus sp.]|nr:phosphoribosylformylglycinamidine cyclo-ligase [Anaerococcus sp.]